MSYDISYLLKRFCENTVNVTFGLVRNETQIKMNNIYIRNNMIQSNDAVSPYKLSTRVLLMQNVHSS